MLNRIFKTILVLSLCIGISLPTNAAVSVSDGSAFVTKAEFAADLNNLSNRMAQLENSLDAKIDSLVSSYLTRNGIWNGSKQDILFGKILFHASKNTPVADSGSSRSWNKIWFWDTIFSVFDWSGSNCKLNVKKSSYSTLCKANKTGLMVVNMVKEYSNKINPTYPNHFKAGIPIKESGYAFDMHEYLYFAESKGDSNWTDMVSVECCSPMCYETRSWSAGTMVISWTGNEDVYEKWTTYLFVTKDNYYGYYFQQVVSSESPVPPITLTSTHNTCLDRGAFLIYPELISIY